MKKWYQSRKFLALFMGAVLFGSCVVANILVAVLAGAAAATPVPESVLAILATAFAGGLSVYMHAQGKIDTATAK